MIIKRTPGQVYLLFLCPSRDKLLKARLRTLEGTSMHPPCLFSSPFPSPALYTCTHTPYPLCLLHLPPPNIRTSFCSGRVSSLFQMGRDRLHAGCLLMGRNFFMAVKNTLRGMTYSIPISDRTSQAGADREALMPPSFSVI